MQATRNWIGALALSLLAGSLHPSCGVAQVSTQYPFCLQGEDYPGWSNCAFTSFQECQASASGTLNECMSNPWYQAGADTAQPSSQGSTVSDGPIVIGPPPR
jgi:hypothetical protein